MKRLIFVFLIFSIVFIIQNPNSEKKIKARDERGYQDFEYVRNDITVMENKIAQHNTNATTELRNSIKYYENVLSTQTSSEEILKIQNLIKAYKNMIIDCETNKKGLIDPIDPFAGARLLIINIIVYFDLFQFKLASELLAFAYENKTLDIEYKPYHTKKIVNTNEIQKIMKDDTISGDGSFTNLFTDEYLALRNFSYSKSYVDESNIKLNIKDRYDFDLSWDGFLNITTNSIYVIQESGILKPFIANIEFIGSGRVPCKYEFKDNYAIITGVPNYISILTIPTSIKNLSTYVSKDGAKDFSVESIGNSAFIGSNLINIYLPYTLKTIGDFAFFSCTLLTTIEIPSSVISIGNYAFQGCSSLKTVYINREAPNITTLGLNVFDNCKALVRIYVPSNSTTHYKNAINWMRYSSFFNHNHLFDTYSPYSYNRHKAHCSCGEYQLKPHVTRIEDKYYVGNNFYAKCIYCNDEVQLGQITMFLADNSYAEKYTYVKKKIL